MKRFLCLFLTLVLAAGLSGCGSSESAASAASEDTATRIANGDVDVDLTVLSSTMVYSEVYNMFLDPDAYMGKIIRMRGQFDVIPGVDEAGEPIPGVYYYLCVIADATACCQQGMEFVLAGDYSYPEDYPPLGEEITVVGEYQTYMEAGTMYNHLINAVLE